MSKQQIIEKIQQYSPKELEEISAILEHLEQKRMVQPSFESLAGAWAGMDDLLYSELTESTRHARQQGKIGDNQR